MEQYAFANYFYLFVLAFNAGMLDEVAQKAAGKELT